MARAEFSGELKFVCNAVNGNDRICTGGACSHYSAQPNTTHSKYRDRRTGFDSGGVKHSAHTRHHRASEKCGQSEWQRIVDLYQRLLSRDRKL
jgi:hypothetical protein